MAARSRRRTAVVPTPSVLLHARAAIPPSTVRQPLGPVGGVSTIFTKIIEGALPGRFVWRDDQVVAFLSIAPMGDGHTLVVPIREVDHWIDLDPDLHAHLWATAKVIGEAIADAFPDRRIGVLVVGEEVPHAHVHLVGFTRARQMSLANQDHQPDPAVLDDHMERVRAALRARGHGAHVPT
jgi:diadenosine tetraphosphate (Ap4A) HIT family hydrolase